MIRLSQLITLGSFVLSLQTEKQRIFSRPTLSDFESIMMLGVTFGRKFSVSQNVDTFACWRQKVDCDKMSPAICRQYGRDFSRANSSITWNRAEQPDDALMFSVPCMQAIIISRLVYAFQSWWGFTSIQAT